ncbi:MAG: hypothetical protein IT350_14285 [Deltaproteobacteria bacterium]|nr:hypothetical protein [Deltaproteobacteria bacterium]
MAKYRPVFPASYGSRYVLDAPTEIQERIDQIDPGFFGGDLTFDDDFGNIEPEPDLGNFTGGFRTGVYEGPDGTLYWNNPDGTSCAAEQDKKTGKWTVICGYGTVGFAKKRPSPGPTKPIVGRY